MLKTRASVLMWRIKLPFVKVDRMQARADKAGGVNERDSARRPGRPLACSRLSDIGNGARKNAARLSTVWAHGTGYSVTSSTQA